MKQTIFYKGDNVPEIEVEAPSDRCYQYKYDRHGNQTLTGLDTREVVKYVRGIFSIATVRETKECLYYHNGKYISMGAEQVECLLESAFREKAGNKLTSHAIKEIMDAIRRSTYRGVAAFDNDLDYVNLANGLFNLKTGVFEPHTDKYFSRIQLPVMYNPDAKCPAIDEVIRRVFKPEDIEKIYEFIGYCLYRDYSIQKAFILLGKGSSGKSRLLAIIRAFIGEDNCAFVSFQQVSDDRFAGADLHGKLVNIAGDLDKKAIQNTGTFKMFTGGDTVRVQRKNQAAFNMINFAKFIFSTNILPPVGDNTTGFFRRPEILHANNTFTINAQDENLLKASLSPEELSGLFNAVVPRLNRLIKAKHYTNETKVDVMAHDYVAASEPTRAFVERHLVETATASEDGARISKPELYARYVKFCEDTGPTVEPDGDYKFGWAIRKAYPSVRDGRVRSKDSNGETHWEPAWVGIKIRDLE